MRLINVRTLQPEEFFDNKIPRYAVLSHTWGADELTLQDFVASKDPDSPCRQLRGYNKVVKACQAAIEKGFNHLWCDTCCIDKTSSAELSEAINSMFRWYSNSGCCLVHLDDFSHDPVKPMDIGDIGHCRWLTRGWCLQELIAPPVISFYDQHWTNFASLDDLLEQLVLHTGIDKEILSDNRPMSTFPVAQRMSWAAGRTTSRVEDEAYCLLGILEINMPLLYGEGRNAFSRLQQEVLRTHDDSSIFLWSEEKDKDGKEPAHMLAPQVSCFASSGNIMFGSGLLARRTRPQFSSTNRGIRVRGAALSLHFLSNPSFAGVHLLPLMELVESSTGTNDESVAERTFPCLELFKVSAGLYVRLPGWVMRDSKILASLHDCVNPEVDFHVANSSDVRASLLEMSNRTAFLFFRFDHPWSDMGLSVEPRDLWDSVRYGFYLDSHYGFNGYVEARPLYDRLNDRSSSSFVIAFTWMALDEVATSEVGSRLKVCLVPLHVWDLYANSSTLAWRVRLAAGHRHSTKIVTPCQGVPIEIGFLNLTIDASNMNLYGSPGRTTKVSNGLIRISWELTWAGYQ